jgi:hypothetical protein
LRNELKLLRARWFEAGVPNLPNDGWLQTFVGFMANSLLWVSLVHEVKVQSLLRAEVAVVPNRLGTEGTAVAKVVSPNFGIAEAIFGSDLLEGHPVFGTGVLVDGIVVVVIIKGD